MTPFFCPYCAEEDLRPNEASHGAWECRGCARVFSVQFIGMLAHRSNQDSRWEPPPDSVPAGGGPGVSD